MAGHSKWKQIKHKKATSDAKRGQLFSKLVKEIMIAVRLGGPLPENNIRLRTSVERSRAAGLPKDNVERAIERASGMGNDDKLQEFLYEATVPGGVHILVEGVTDNKNRTLSEIRHIIMERGGKMAESGSLIWNFEKIGTLKVSRPQEKSREEAELAFIDAGADNFTESEDGWFLETKFSALDRVREELEQKGIRLQESGHDYKPRMSLVLSKEERESIEPLLDELSEHDDVQEVYTNL